MSRSINTRTEAITAHTPLVASYLAEIRRYNPLTSEEEYELAVKMHNGDINARDMLFKSNLRFCFSLCKHFAKGDEVVDLCNVASLAVLENINKFDETKGFRFISWAVSYMRMGISEYFRTTAPLIRKSNAAKIGSRDKKITDKFYAENGYMPSEDTLLSILAEEYGIEVKDKRDIAEMQITYLDKAVADDEDSCAFGEVGGIALTMSSHNASEETFESESNHNAAMVALASLNERDRAIMECLYIKEMSLEEVAKRYGLCAERIRQIADNSIKKLQTRKERIRKAM